MKTLDASDIHDLGYGFGLLHRIHATSRTTRPLSRSKLLAVDLHFAK